MKYFFKFGKTQNKPILMVKYKQGLSVWYSHFFFFCLAFLWIPYYYNTVTTLANLCSMNLMPVAKGQQLDGFHLF